MSPRPKGVFVIINTERLEKPVFRRVGTAFVNRDQSLNVHLDALPIGGKLHIRDIDPLPRTTSQGES